MARLGSRAILFGAISGVFRLTFNAVRYTLTIVIKSFRCANTERLYHRERIRQFRSMELVARRKLRQLDGAAELRDSRSPPGNRLERLQGDREGQYSIRINDQWRICFSWQEGDAYNVEIVDYHS